MTPLAFARSVQSLNRLRQIAQVLTRHGFGHIVARTNLGRFVPVWIRRKAREGAIEEGASAVGRRLSRVCAELGPTFIKFGQTMSTRPDIIPPEVLAQLRTLQDKVPPFDTPTAMGIIAAELGRPVDACFGSIGGAPFASASIGQVYRAQTLDGDDVVVKVRRPNIDRVIALDMQLLHWLASSIEDFMPELRIYRPTMLVAELDEMLTRELDYIHEASTTTRFGEAFAGDPGIRIPHVHWALCSPRVLTLETLEGASAAALFEDSATAKARVDRPLAARRLADCYLKQVFEVGLFHADPHPGNILIDASSTIGLIDFGQVGTITDELMTQLVVMVYATVNREIDVVIDALADLDTLGPATDRRQLHRSLQTLLDKYYGLPLKRVDLTTLTNEFTEVVRRNDVVVPREWLMLAKAMGTVASVTARFDPDLNLLELLKPRIKGALGDRLSPQRLGRGSLVWGYHLFNLVRNAPVQLRDFLRGLRSGRWSLQVRHENIERLVRELDRSSNRLALAIVIAAVIVGSSVVIAADTNLTPLGIRVQLLGIVGYVIAGVMGLGLSWAIFRSGRLH